ncbi:MAG TPA: hypothetical protein VJ063_13925 [Verrucomicrobiae bacterium]|nr:hypothetical protein [Verrucomicrobiae bacterium]
MKQKLTFRFGRAALISALLGAGVSALFFISNETHPSESSGFVYVVLAVPRIVLAKVTGIETNRLYSVSGGAAFFSAVNGVLVAIMFAVARLLLTSLSSEGEP